MSELTFRLRNCFGISEMESPNNPKLCFDEHNNVLAIYARNGMMKTSFAKTMRKIQEDKKEEIRDCIYDLPGSVDVKIDNVNLTANDVFVIKPFEPGYESDVSGLLVNNESRERLKSVLKSRDKVFTRILEMSKIRKGVGKKKFTDLENVIADTFGLNGESILKHLVELAAQSGVVEESFANIPYEAVFNDKMISKLRETEFQARLKDYLAHTNEVYGDYPYLSNGGLTLARFKSLGVECDELKYFEGGQNALLLAGNLKIDGANKNRLVELAKEVDGRLTGDASFKAVAKILSQEKGAALLDVVTKNPWLLEWLLPERLHDLSKNIMLAYFKKCNTDIEALCESYSALAENLTSQTDTTPWKEAVDIFDRRFIVPYKMHIANLDSAVIGESIPRVQFEFSRNGRAVSLARKELENADVLSQGEQRALYLLNMIFDIEQIKRSDEKRLLIIDDIAESFDYKNRYAIVEYLNELAHYKGFTLLILTHNFDFYRLVCSRLGIRKENRFEAQRNESGKVRLAAMSQMEGPFKNWLSAPSREKFFAYVPLLRNLIEYAYKIDDGEAGRDYMTLTHVLHVPTRGGAEPTVSEVKRVFKQRTDFKVESLQLEDSESMIQALKVCADDISQSPSLENKIVLSMASRIYAEEYMIGVMSNYSGNIIGHGGVSMSFTDYLNSIRRDQTAELFDAFRRLPASDRNRESDEVLDAVRIMTPENIHLNAFMYEPLIDMDIGELKRLYKRAKGLMN